MAHDHSPDEHHDSEPKSGSPERDLNRPSAEKNAHDHRHGEGDHDHSDQDHHGPESEPEPSTKNDAPKNGHSHAGHAHSHHHGHDHDHHGHSHGPSHYADATKGRAFALGVGLNLAFVLVEGFYGFVSNSVSLLADAAHNLGDVVGLLMAWAALRLATRKPSATHTYGMRRATVLAALFNSILLVAAVGGVAWEAIARLKNPQPVPGLTMLCVAAVGVVVNGSSALFFFRDRKGDVNMRGAYLHLAADAAVSLGVVVTGALILKTGLMWLDPAASLLVSIVILWGTWGLTKEVTNLLLDAVPGHIDIEKVRTYLESLPQVTEVHDLHVWAMSTTEVAMTAHLVMPWCPAPPVFLGTLSETLRERFRIDHSTVQIEPDDAAGACTQASDDVV